MTAPPLVCFDANIAIAFALPDEPFHARAIATVQELYNLGITLCAPAMFAYECDSVIRLRVYTGKISEAEASEARAFVAALQVQIEFVEADRDRAFEIARDYGQPRAYDASYAAHAEARGVELLTIDEPFFQAVNGNKKPSGKPALSFVKLLS